MCAAEYDLEKDVMYTAQKRGPILLNTMLQGVGQSVSGTIGKQPDTRCLLLIAHDTNITMVRTLMNFVRILPGYTRGSSSLVVERWRDTKSGERFLHVYFQGQKP